MCVSRSVSLCNYLPSLILIIKSLPLVNKVMCWYRICSVGKETACNAGDPGLIPGLGRSGWRRDRLPTPVFLGFPCASVSKESTCNAGDLGSIPGLGRTAGEGTGYPLQDSGLENSMDYSPWGRKELAMTEQLSLSLFYFTIEMVQ